MALQLDTGHPLFGNITAIICVDDDNSIKDLKGDICTPDAAVTVGSSTYGRHFTTTIDGGNAKGVALTTGFQTRPASNGGLGTTFVVINAGNSRNNRGTVLNGSTGPCHSPSCFTSNFPAVYGTGTGATTLLGTTDLIGTGAHSFGAAYNASVESKVFANGVNEASGAVQVGFASDIAIATYIGGNESGAFGAFAADYVWIVHFDKFLSNTEVQDLHNSLGAGNTFSLVLPSTPSGVIGAELATSTLSGLTASITGASGAITITTEPLKNNTGTLLASTGSITADVYNISTGALVVRKTGLTSDVAGVVSFTDALLVTATEYRVIISISTSDGVARITAS